MCLVDLRSDGYRISFPKEEHNRVSSNDRYDYIYSVVAPNGRSVFAVRRIYDSGLPSLIEDILVRRPLITGTVGPEEIVNTPFVNIFQFSVSSNEEYLVIAGRLRHATEGNRDAIFLFKRNDGTSKYVAPYASLSENIRSLNVAERGDLVIFENRGIVTKFEASGGPLVLAEQHPGQFPTLIPHEHRYLYVDRGWLMADDGKGGKRELIRAPSVVGAIRVSPDGRFIAFGEDLFGDSRLTRLRICEIDSKNCADGPDYLEWIAGRETFWIER